MYNLLRTRRTGGLRVFDHPTGGVWGPPGETHGIQGPQSLVWRLSSHTMKRGIKLSIVKGTPNEILPQSISKLCLTHLGR
jgi:hypothetical protein